MIRGKKLGGVIDRLARRILLSKVSCARRLAWLTRRTLWANVGNAVENAGSSRTAPYAFLRHALQLRRLMRPCIPFL